MYLPITQQPARTAPGNASGIRAGEERMSTGIGGGELRVQDGDPLLGALQLLVLLVAQLFCSVPTQSGELHNMGIVREQQVQGWCGKVLGRSFGGRVGVRRRGRGMGKESGECQKDRDKGWGRMVTSN
jgi:hypothetical protein